MNQLQEIINKNSYLKEWREKTSVCLLAINMPINGIILAITGNFDKRTNLHNYCKKHNLNEKEVAKILY